ncbi:MAG: hypothetical protein AAB884_01620 [Patescibacteria group bacterium]
MAAEKKIFLNRLDDINVVVDVLIQASAERVILNIPRDSVLGKSIHNFQVLKRESDTAQKELVVESIDDHVLELASLVGITALNPVFKLRERSVSDILPRAEFPKKVTEKIRERIVREEAPHKFEPLAKPDVEEDLTAETGPRERHFNFKKWLVFLSLLFVFVLVFWGLGIKILPKATVAISLKKVPVSLDELVEASSKVKQLEYKNGKISLPAELLVNRKNLEMSFEAHGKDKVETKATGNLTVYNAYSSKDQILVKSTRFETPDKKIFRLDNQVTIPGAKIVDGKIEPSKIEVRITADQAGEAYNISPTSFKIPGFKGTPRYEGFYAESLKSMSGGFVGERAVPTEDDTLKAKEALRGALENSLKSEVAIFVAERFKSLESSMSFNILKEDIHLEDGEKTFSIFGEAEMRNLVFEEEMLKNALIDRAKEKITEDLRVRDFNLDYSNLEVDLANGKINFRAKISVIFEPNLIVDVLVHDLLGKNETFLNSYLSQIPGLEKAKVSLWPFWVNSVPENPKHVKITVD